MDSLKQPIAWGWRGYHHRKARSGRFSVPSSRARRVQFRIALDYSPLFASAMSTSFIPSRDISISNAFLIGAWVEGPLYGESHLRRAMSIALIGFYV